MAENISAATPTMLPVMATLRWTRACPPTRLLGARTTGPAMTAYSATVTPASIQTGPVRRAVGWMTAVS